MNPTMLDTILTPGLLTLRASFQRRGFDIRLVGGCCRDMLAGLVPKDIDLCTDANPDEQIAIYREDGIQHYETGLKHGTVSVMIDDVLLEITSLRTDTGHDGRHAEVTYIRDWELDLQRRDLTINTISMTFDGELIDPFGGAKDLANGVVRFVGNPVERMTEDYLRILRFFRFHGRFGGERRLDAEATRSIALCKEGLARISRERVWSEISRIISGPMGPSLLRLIRINGIDRYIGLPDGSEYALIHAYLYTRNPASLMAAYLGSVEAVAAVAQAWKWSGDEARLARHVVLYGLGRCPIDLDQAKRLVVLSRVPKDNLVEAFLAVGWEEWAQLLKDWTVPVCPVQGRDLMAIGHKPGPAMGELLHRIVEEWADSDYQADRETLLRNHPAEPA